MSEGYQYFLDAAIQHLLQLKAQGERFVNVSPQTLALLNAKSGPGSTSASAPSTRMATAGSAARAALPAPVRAAPAAGPSAGPPSRATGFSSASPAQAPFSSTPGTEEKSAAFAELQRRALACVKCPHLVSARRNVVFGIGSIGADLMFVGEAPGADEDEQGEPFVGKAGQLLTRIIQTMGLSRESVYIANILKCRPDTPGATAGNRKPTAEEMATCIPYLHEQIDLIRPRALVALGATAVEGLLGKTAGITRLRGNWQTYRGIPLMPTFHPAYLLRNQAMSEKRKTWEDMLQVMQRLGMPISEKQRNYFLKP